jgi:hypothetical protein
MNLSAGKYSIYPTVSLYEPVNYTVEYTPGILTVTPVILTVKAEDKVIFEGDPLPVFTSIYSGFKNNDQNSIVAGPEYSLEPEYSGSAGYYSVKPSGLKLLNPGNYIINYRSGTLSVHNEVENREEKKEKTEVEQSRSGRSATAIEQNSTTGRVSVYPNPVMNKVTISLGNSTIVDNDIILYDLQGRKLSVTRAFSSANFVVLDMAKFRPGTYIVTVRSHESLKTFRIVKK